jgi:predicted phosphodiesterase
MFGKKIFLHHGHLPCQLSDDMDIIIQGHTHLCSLTKKNGRIFMNPGTISRPRNNIHTYGILDRARASLIEIKTGNILASLKL